MKWLVGSGILLLAGVAVPFSGVLGPSKDGVFHPDHGRVSNEFQTTTSRIVGGGGVSSVEPDSECKQTADTVWRCYRRWALVNHPEAAEVLQGDVNVYEDRVVVGSIERVPDAN